LLDHDAAPRIDDRDDRMLVVVGEEVAVRSQRQAGYFEQLRRQHPASERRSRGITRRKREP
jgi:hypothetical protein